MLSQPKILIDAGRSRRGWSSWQYWLYCAQKGAYKAAQRSETETPLGEKSPPLIKGSLWHVLQAHRYAQQRALQTGKDPSIYYDPTEAMLKVAKDGFVQQEIQDHLFEIYTDYCTQYNDDDALLSILFVEEEFDADIHGNDYTARLDLGWQAPDGLRYIVDHKHTYKVDKQTKRKYILSGQFMGAQWFGSQMWGPKFGGVILNLSCSMPMSVRSHFKSPGMSFMRCALPVAPAMFARFPQNIKYAADLQKRLGDANTLIDDYPRAMNEQICMTAYGECEFFERCQWGK